MAIGQGRYPKPAAVRRAEGKRGHNRPIMEELTAPAGCPDMPDGLTLEAQAEWCRVTVEMARVKTLARTDRSAICEYCQLWDNVRRARATLTEGYSFTTISTGQVRQLPEVNIMLRASALMLQYLDRFGLNPSARARIQIAPEAPVSAKFQEFLDGGK